MNSNDWHEGGSLLAWLGAAVVVASGASSAGCGWVPGHTSSTVHVPSRPIDPDVAAPGAGECARRCGEDASSCLVGRIVIPESAPPYPRRERSEHPAVVCRTKHPGRFETWGSFGRRPVDAPRSEDAPRTVAEYFARAADAELRSIGAFRQLALDLEALAAPDEWVAEARTFARDEARHAREAVGIARALGFRGRVSNAAVLRAKRRRPEPLALALENATGGCVNELFGAWVQLFQSRFAPRAEQRASAHRIARDEASHAALAFRLFDWLNERLTPDERRQVRAAVRKEIEIHASAADLPAAITDELGLPGSAVLRTVAALFDRAFHATPGAPTPAREHTGS